MASAGGGTAQATTTTPTTFYNSTSTAHLLLKQLLGFFNEGLITKDVWEEKQREILSPLVVGMPVVNTNHTLSKGKRPLAVDEDDGGGLAESSKKKKRSKSAAHVHEEGNADADDDESSETTRTSLICETLLNMSSKPVDNIDERDGVEAVVAAMQRHVHRADVQHQACGALSHLAITGEHDARIVDSGGVEAVVAAMKLHGSHAGVQDHACMALRSLSRNDKNRARIVDLGGVEVLPAATNPAPPPPQ